MKHYDVIILGGGAGGLMCAAQLRQKSTLSIAIIEGNNRPALKLKASGGGKCNLTNVEVDESHYLGDQSLIKHVLSAFPQKALLEYFREGGLRPVIRKERYYFCPKSSDEVISILMGKAHGCDVLLGHKILSVEGHNPFVVSTERGKFSADKIVVATGGASYKELGASDIGLKIAQSYGIKTVPFSPALVGLTLQPKEFWMKELSGISCRARIHVAGKTLDEDLLFAHKGISGLVVLSASLYWFKGEIVIDFLPDFDLDTIKKEKNKIDGLKIGIVGDLKYGRTVYSLLYALSNYDVDIRLISPESLKIRSDSIYEIQKKISLKESTNLDEFIDELDVIYVTRIQKERFPDEEEYQKVRGSYKIGLDVVNKMKENAIILHPLPRVDEISTDVDSTKQAKYFQQAEYGKFTRAALLSLVLNEKSL